MSAFAIGGTRTAGTNSAHTNLERQLPLIAKEFPEVEHCHRGTVNLLLDRGLMVVRPDHRTQPIPWDPSFGDGEVFDLLRIELEAPNGAAPINGWLYIPHGSPWRDKPRVHEVLLPKRIALEETARCTLHIPREALELPYLPGGLIFIA